MGLIDSDSAIKEISRFVGYLDDDTILRLQIALKRLPTIDSAPVVRCGECRHKYLEHDVWICLFGLIMPGPDGFCSYGEKVTE